jgi:hypothetical protein
MRRGLHSSSPGRRGRGGGAALPAARANAGPDFFVAPSAVGTLNGTGSTALNGGAITSYQWTQTAGTAVTINNGTLATATFTATSGTGDLTFMLTVNGTYTDSVTAHVSAPTVNAGADKWDVGFGKTVALSGTYSGGTGPFTVTWSGAPDWMPLTSTSVLNPSFTTPAFDQVEPAEDRFGVIGIPGRKYGSNIQLKLTVKDTATNVTNYDYLNVRIITPNNGARIQALGVPVFINGGLLVSGSTVTSWKWSGTPTFKLTDLTTNVGASTANRVVCFTPTTAGTFQVICERAGGTQNDVQVVDVVVAKYVGVGALADGAIADPAKGNCAGCHAGQVSFLDDKVTEWSGTGHAHHFDNLVGTSYQNGKDWQDQYCLACHTVGFQQGATAVNDGFDDAAQTANWVLQGSTSASVKTNFPTVQEKANIQCENCHGPGSLHAGDTKYMDANLSPNICGQCHPQIYEWKNSPHNIAKPLTSSTGTCLKCHQGQGFVQFSDGLPLTAPAVFQPQTCGVCHDPHSADTGRSQLRFIKEATLPDNITKVQLGKGAVCAECHNSRRDTTLAATITARTAPHDSTVAEVFGGANVYKFNSSDPDYAMSPHARPDKFIIPGATETDGCATCHLKTAYLNGSSGATYDAIGGHTLKMEAGDGVTILATEVSSGTATFDAAKTRITFASGNLMSAVKPGDTITVTAGANAGSTFTVSAVDTGRSVKVVQTPVSGDATAWSILQTRKLLTQACTQCHPVGNDFNVTARADYDGNGIIEGVQTEFDSLMVQLSAAIDAKLTALTGVTPTTWSHTSTKYTNAVDGTKTFKSDASWDNVYKAAYHYILLSREGSHGVHNTGFAIDLLRKSIKALTGTNPPGADYTPVP